MGCIAQIIIASINRSSNWLHAGVSGGSGQYAKLCMVYEPNPGAGFEFENSVVGGSVPKEYVPAVVKGTENELLNGIRMGFPVVDVKASLKERC